jgi:integrase
LLNALRSFAQYCVGAELIERDPTIGIKAPKRASDGHRTWTEDEIAQYRRTHRDGAARLAFELHLDTGQRTSDVLPMGWQHVRNGAIHIVQMKTKMAVVSPIGRDLQRVLAAVPRTNLTFLTSGNGTPFKQSQYNALWRRWCEQAGLVGLTPHGLRKAFCRRMAEAGRPVHEIAARSGHKTLAEIQRYTDKADRERLAWQSFAAMQGPNRERKVSRTPQVLDKTYP